MVVNLGSNKGDKNYDSYHQVTRLQNLLLMNFVDTTENNLSHKGKAVTRKVRKSLVK